MPEPGDRPLAEDWSTPVIIDPSHDVSEPEAWQWKQVPGCVAGWHA